MTSVTTFPALTPFVALLIALLLKMSLTSAAQVVTRLRARTFLLPEDAVLMGTKTVASEAPLVGRFALVWRNDGENLPYFLVCALAYTLAGASATAAWWLFGSYVALRYAHTAAYLGGRQPWRAILYLGSLAMMWLVAIQTVLTLTTRAGPAA